MKYSRRLQMRSAKQKRKNNRVRTVVSVKKGLGETLSSLRREKGLSQRQASAQLGISQALLSHYENNAREPKLEFISKACDYYNVSSDYLLGRCDDRSGKSAALIETLTTVMSGLQQLKSAEDELLNRLIMLTVDEKAEKKEE